MVFLCFKEATKKDVKPESNEMIDVVSNDQNIQVESHGNYTTDNNGNCTTGPTLEPLSKPLPEITESGQVDSTSAATSFTQSRNSQTESSAVKRSSLSPPEGNQVRSLFTPSIVISF